MISYLDSIPEIDNLKVKEQKEKLEKNLRVISSGQCRDCGKELKAEFCPSEALDMSKMKDYYCARCYRHQLVFDMDWPERGTLLAKKMQAATLYKKYRIDSEKMSKALKDSRRPTIVKLSNNFW